MSAIGIILFAAMSALLAFFFWKAAVAAVSIGAEPEHDWAIYCCDCGNVTRAADEPSLESQGWRLVAGHPCCPLCLDRPAPAHLYEEDESA